MTIALRTLLVGSFSVLAALAVACSVQTTGTGPAGADGGSSGQTSSGGPGSADGGSSGSSDAGGGRDGAAGDSGAQVACLASNEDHHLSGGRLRDDVPRQGVVRHVVLGRSLHHPLRGGLHLREQLLRWRVHVPVRRGLGLQQHLLRRRVHVPVRAGRELLEHVLGGWLRREVKAIPTRREQR